MILYFLISCAIYMAFFPALGVTETSELMTELNVAIEALAFSECTTYFSAWKMLNFVFVTSIPESLIVFFILVVVEENNFHEPRVPQL